MPADSVIFLIFSIISGSFSVFYFHNFFYSEVLIFFLQLLKTDLVPIFEVCLIKFFSVPMDSIQSLNLYNKYFAFLFDNRSSLLPLAKMKRGSYGWIFQSCSDKKFVLEKTVSIHLVGLAKSCENFL